MPEISRFLGIVIAILYREHNPPHFHASYGSYDILLPAKDRAGHQCSAALT
jgi:hypothetical protein